MQIRKTKKEDISRLSKIFKTEKAKKPYSQILTQKEAFNKIKNSLKDKDVYTIDVNNKPEGFFICELKKEKNQIYLDELWISEKNQGKGYGKVVMNFIENKYREKGLKEITLVADKNANASKFYEKRGYQIKNEWLYMIKKIDSDIGVDIVKNKDLIKKQKDIINRARIKEFGKENKKDFSKDYEPETLWFFVKKKNKIVSFGGIRPIEVKFLGETYKIGGICSTISLEKKKGYGKIMVSSMMNYSIKIGKTILGFTGKTEFFKKADMGTKKDFIKRFVWIKQNGEKVYDNGGDGIYYEGKDKLISKILKTKSPVYIFVEHW